MKILILGGTGTMGLPLSIQLANNENNEVYVLCHKSKGVKRVHYIIGDYNDEDVQNKIRSCKWDCIVDLLWHNEKKFDKTFEILINLTGHYISFSTAAVYADSGDSLLKEDDLRFLDQKYSDEEYYHLSKARMENIIFNSNYPQWTIIRPHVTFNSYRLPLDIWEQDVYLQRFFQDKTVILSDELFEKKTSFTYGGDVAKLVVGVIYAGSKSFGQVYNVVSDDKLTWGEVIGRILFSLEKITGKKLRLKIVNSNTKYGQLEKMLPHKADRLKYDRLLNRTLDNTKVKSLIGDKIEFSDLDKRVYNCLKERIEDFNGEIKYYDPISIAYMDSVAKERTSLKYIAGKRGKIKYFFFRYFISYDVALKMWKLLKR